MSDIVIMLICAFIAGLGCSRIYHMQIHKREVYKHHDRYQALARHNAYLLNLLCEARDYIARHP